MTLFPGYSNLVDITDEIIDQYYSTLKKYFSDYLQISLYFCSDIYINKNQKIFDIAWRDDVDNIFNQEILFQKVIHQQNTDQINSLSFKHFIDCSKQLILPRIKVQSKEQYSSFNSLKQNVQQDKAMQVIQFSRFLSQKYDLDQLKIIDFGAGKGYLSSFLAFDKNYDVVAAEASYSHALKFYQRIKKISKQYNNTDNLKLALGLITTNTQASDVYFNSFEWSKFNDQQIQTFDHVKKSQIQGDFAAEFPHFDDKVPTIVLGLHACGDLSQLCLNLACQDVKVAVICCCYAHITQEHFPQTSQGKDIINQISKESKDIGIRMKGFDLFLPKILFSYASVEFDLTYQHGLDMLQSFNTKAMSMIDSNQEEQMTSALFLSQNNWMMKLHIIIRHLVGQVFESFILVERLVGLRHKGVSTGIFSIIGEYSSRGFGICTE